MPAPTAAWSFNGQPLQADKSVVMEITQTSTKLTLTEAKVIQAGTYVLKVENVVGFAQAEFNISVKGKMLTYVLVAFSLTQCKRTINLETCRQV